MPRKKNAVKKAVKKGGLGLFVSVPLGFVFLGLDKSLAGRVSNSHTSGGRTALSTV